MIGTPLEIFTTADKRYKIILTRAKGGIWLEAALTRFRGVLAFFQ